MKNKAVNAPIKFEEIVKVMINRLIDRFYPCLSIGGTINSELKILQKRSKNHFSGKRTKIYITFIYFCFVLFWSKESPRNGISGLGSAKNKTRAKTGRRGGGG